MKKTILGIVLTGLVLFLYSVCFAVPIQVRQNSPNSDNNFERLAKLPCSNAKVKSLSEPAENPEIGTIHNVVPAPVIDNNPNRYCAAYYNVVKVAVPDGGLEFYLVYYHRIKNTDGSWSEWNKDYTGGSWYFTPEDARDYHVEYYSYLLEENGTLPPSKGQFLVEMYDSITRDLLDAFVVSRYRYWYPLLESEIFDDEGYLTLIP